MPNLKRLEIMIPLENMFLEYNSRSRDYYRDPSQGHQEDTVHCIYPNEVVEVMSPEERIRHTIRDHSRDEEYWDLWADLKKNAASKDLTIVLVIQYDNTSWVPEDEDSRLKLRYYGCELRQARWIVADASIMGYEAGHARWEHEGPRNCSYRVHYFKNPMLAVIPDGHENSLLEPPALPGHQEESHLAGPTESMQSTEPTS